MRNQPTPETPTQPRKIKIGHPAGVILLWLVVIGVLIGIQFFSFLGIKSESQVTDTVTPTLQAGTGTPVVVGSPEDIRLTDGLIAGSIVVLLIILVGAYLSIRWRYPRTQPPNPSEKV